jgi:tetratricopeptide (TPR) repeat protein
LAYFNAANLYFAQGRWEQALEYYNRVLDLDPTDDAAILNRGITKAQLGRLEEALDDINAAGKLN